MTFGDVIDEFHDDDRLAHTGSAECAHLATLGEGANQVDDLDSCLQDLRLGILVDQRRRMAVNREGLIRLNGSAFVAWFAKHIKDATENPLAHRDRDGLAQGTDGHPTLQTFRGGHGDRTNPVLTEMLLDLKGHLGRFSVDGVIDLECVVDLGQFALLGVELGIDDRADDLNDVACVAHESLVVGLGKGYASAIWAVVISRSSVVMLACRALLYSSVRSFTRPFALSVALFMATMRALCSEARASRIIWKTVK